MKAPVAIIGTGLLCALGADPARAWRSFAGPRAAGRAAERLRVEAPGGWLPSFDPRQVLDRRRRRFVTRDVVLGLAAARQALACAGVERLAPDRDWGCFVGAPPNFGDPADWAAGIHAALDAGHRFDPLRFGSEGVPLLNPLGLLKALANGLVYAISVEHKFRGLGLNFCSGAVSSTLAVGAALRAIRSGRIRRALVVGYDGVPFLAALNQMDGRIRATPALAEAAAAVVLDAMPRSDAAVRAVVAGFGARHSSGRGAARSRDLRLALSAAAAEAGVALAQIDRVYTDGWTRTQHARLDVALRDRRQGPRARRVETARGIGRCPAASGVVATVLAAEEIAARRAPGATAVVNGGAGGACAALVLHAASSLQAQP